MITGAALTIESEANPRKLPRLDMAIGMMLPASSSTPAAAVRFRPSSSSQEPAAEANGPLSQVKRLLGRARDHQTRASGGVTRRGVAGVP